MGIGKYITQPRHLQHFSSMNACKLNHLPLPASGKKPQDTNDRGRYNRQGFSVVLQYTLTFRSPLYKIEVEKKKYGKYNCFSFLTGFETMAVAHQHRFVFTGVEDGSGRVHCLLRVNPVLLFRSLFIPLGPEINRSSSFFLAGRQQLL